MGTKIEWTDETWNPVTGCTKVSAGCKHCYAEGVAKRFWGERKFTEVRCHEDRLEAPLHWRDPRMVFVNSMSDLFHEDVPDEFIENVLHVCAKNPRHTFQILTKRPERMRDVLIEMEERDGFYGHANIWLGVSAENQEAAIERLPYLRKTPAAVRFVSFEPLLGPININMNGIDWVIVGGESGPGARPMDPDWALSIMHECDFEGRSFFIKQMGGFPNKRAKLSEIPEDLRIREWPTAPKAAGNEE